MPNTLTTIGDLAFKGCTGLAKIEIPASVQVIGRWAFEFCTMLKSVEIPNSVIEIKDFAFEGCTTLRSVKLSPSVMVIGKAAFRYCGRLKDFQGLRPDINLGDDVFYQCALSIDSNEKKTNDFEQAAQKYIVPKIKEWQKKREYETTAQYKKRVTKENQDKKVVLLEFGVGFNTPGIIRFPFEQMTLKNKKWTLVRFNKETRCYYDLGERFVAEKEIEI